MPGVGTRRVEPVWVVTENSPAWLEAIRSIGPELVIALIALLVFATIWIFRAEFKLAIGRLSRAAVGSVVVDLADAQNQPSPGIPPLVESAAAVESQLQSAEPRPGGTSVTQMLPEVATLFTPPLPQDHFAKVARFFVTVAYFEYEYRLIFGQQLLLLQLANGHSATTADAKHFYSESQRQGNLAQSYENFVDFIVKSGFLAIHEDKLLATPLGKQFLLYIALEGHPFDKPW
jgi:hypothetical protein